MVWLHGVDVFQVVVKLHIGGMQHKFVAFLASVPLHGTLEFHPAPVPLHGMVTLFHPTNVPLHGMVEFIVEVLHSTGRQHGEVEFPSAVPLHGKVEFQPSPVELLHSGGRQHGQVVFPGNVPSHGAVTFTTVVSKHEVLPSQHETLAFLSSTNDIDLGEEPAQSRS